jgi:hypothetical protein
VIVETLSLTVIFAMPWNKSKPKFSDKQKAQSYMRYAARSREKIPPSLGLSFIFTNRSLIKRERRKRLLKRNQRTSRIEIMIDEVFTLALNGITL